jgi:hypothetical protein
MVLKFLVNLVNHFISDLAELINELVKRVLNALLNFGCIVDFGVDFLECVCEIGLKTGFMVLSAFAFFGITLEYFLLGTILVCTIFVSLIALYALKVVFL